MRSRFTLTFLLALAFGHIALAATRVELVVDEALPNRSVPWPVTTGVPFPRGGLTAVEQCRLVDDLGVEQPLQAKVAATWDAAGASIRWLTIDFIALPGKRYALEFGPEIRRAALPTPLRVVPGETTRVETGRIALDFAKTGPSALGAIRVDLNQDGQIAAEEIVASGAAAGDHYAVQSDGLRTVSAADGAERQVVVEQTGPVRACVRVDGFYTGPKGERILAYRTRYHIFAGLGLLKVIDEFRVVGSTKGVTWRDVGFALDLPAVERREIALDQSGDPGSQVLRTKWDADVASIASFQETYRHYGNPEYHAAAVATGPFGERRLAQTDRMGEWMQSTGPRGTVTGSLRWFWQQFPKEWEATPGQLVLHLWSPRAGALDFSEAGLKKFLGPAGEKYLVQKDADPAEPLQSFFISAAQIAAAHDGVDGLGINKHHEICYHFGRTDETAVGAEYGSLAAHPPLALATGAWNCGTDVFGPLEPRPNDHASERVVDTIFDLGRYAQDSFGDYGWWLFGAGPHYSYHWDPATRRHYADGRRFEYHTYGKETQLWWNYLRSGERKFYDWAIPSENHWVDIAVSHAPTTCFSAWRGGERDPRTLHWARGDWSIDNALHHVRHHNNAEAWLRGASQFWGSYHRTLETTTLAYYLTGDERYNDVVGYWRDYFAGLAGKTNASPDLAEIYREQAWYEPVKPGEAPQTWARQMRDYAPFNSGSRHQMTLFFNLATLYEHTWDPAAGQALQDYADAFLDRDHRIGIWRSQDNSLPAHYEGPSMLHFWMPALWKYARVTGDAKLLEAFPGLYDEAYAADPFNESGDVGIYSNSFPGYGYYFTRDPRLLTYARLELARLKPNGEPLANPDAIGPRLYNPYAPIASFAAIPRLEWALSEARRTGVEVPPPPPLFPQRTPIAFTKAAGVARRLTLWGWDPELRLIDPQGQPLVNLPVETERHASPLTPFDCRPAQFEVYLHRLTIPADLPAGVYTLVPRLELAVLADSGRDPLLTNAARPLRLRPNDVWRVSVPSDAGPELRLESAKPAAFRVTRPDGTALPAKPAGLALIMDLTGVAAGTRLEISNPSVEPAWFQIAGWPEEACWGTFQTVPAGPAPDRRATLAALPPRPEVPETPFMPGRFGQAVVVRGGKSLRLPDHVELNGETVRLFDMKQGTIEFWVRQMWDDRLNPVRRPVFLSNGLVQGWSPWSLPVHEWAHVAIVWRPAKRDPNLTLLHTYVNGLDQANYRSLWWSGYGDRPYSFPRGEWLKELRLQAPPDAPFAIDDLRISAVPRYANRDVEFGNRQTFNPVRFTPATEPTRPDADTFLLFPFDDDLKDAARWKNLDLQGELLGK